MAKIAVLLQVIIRWHRLNAAFSVCKYRVIAALYPGTLRADCANLTASILTAWYVTMKTLDRSE